ncbi:MAG: glycerophosphodiester phosphodiesterase [Elusimicrobia bacterium]|nr:glycerophosphodiester phosphodiesterase [Elusimicrobiota bacterium]
MLVIAHRGASAYAPENSLEAFQLALEMGAQALEMDIHQTADTRLVVSHDPPRSRAAKRPPALEEVLDQIRQHSPRTAAPLLCLELKASASPSDNFEQEVLQKVPGPLVPNVIFSSFQLRILKRLRQLSRTVRIGHLVGSTSPKEVKELAGELKPDSLHLSLKRFHPSWARLAEKLKVPLYVYTVNDTATCCRLEKCGVQGVFSDYPDLLSSRWERAGGSL